MRIAITGAHGTGKTTLGRRLAERFALAELPTPGRIMASRDLPVNEDATVVSQALAWMIQVGLEASADSWVANRSLLDVWAYAALALERSRPTFIEGELLREMETTTRLVWPKRYDAVFYTPPRLALVADEVRSRDPRFQAAVNRKIASALRDWRVEHIIVDVTSADDLARAEAVVADLAR